MSRFLLHTNSRGQQMFNEIQLSNEYQNLLNRIDALDLLYPFHNNHYAEMQEINFDFAYLKAKSEREPFLPYPTSKVLALSTHTSHEEMISLLDSLANDYSENTKSADDLETVIYSNINNYDFKAMNIRVKAQVDFLDLYFEIGRSTTRHDIKKYLTEKTGITHYISEYMNGFIIRIHDMNSLKELQHRIHYLRNYELNLSSLRVMEIELAIDFYRFKHKALVTALFKSLRLPHTTKNFRVFKNQLGVFTPIPTTPISMMSKLDNDYNVGINHKFADEYWHLYVKMTDNNKQLLPDNQWRIRTEKNIKHNVLSKMDNRLINLKRIILDGFKGLSFTQLGIHAPQDFKNSYKDMVKPFGLEQKIYYDKSRHKRKLSKHVEKNTALNQLVSNSVHNLLRNFTITSK